MRESILELKTLLKAKVKCIWIDTYEEAEVIKDIKAILKDFPAIKLHSWSMFEGLKELSLTSGEADPEPNAGIDFNKLFRTILSLQNEKKENNKNQNIFLVKDFHLINETPIIKRALRDLKEYPEVDGNYNPIIFVSPIINLPIEWEKLVTILNYDTPSEKEVKVIIDAMSNNLKKILEKNGITDWDKIEPPTQEERKQMTKACIGLTFNQTIDVLKKSIAKYNNLSIDAIMDEKIQLIKKTGVLDYKVPTARFEDIGGNESFKSWVEEIEESMSEEASSFGCARPKGYLSLGIPGTAKTFAAEAIANKWRVPFLQLNMARIMDKLVGQSEKKIEQAFKIAKACAPCVLLIDEVEKALAGTKSSNSSDAGTTSRVFSTVLQFLC